jgi:PAS domain S-box-containing protein
LTYPDDRAAYAEAFQALMAGHRESFVAEKRCLRHDGTAFWNRASVSALRTDATTSDRAVAVLEDLTDRREAEHETQRLARRLTTILESVTDAFVTFDTDMRFTYLNPEAERLLERSRDELLGRRVFDAFPEARGTESDVAYTRALHGGESQHFEQHYPPLERTFEVRVYPSEEGLAVYFQDISERRAAEARLRESEQRFRSVARATADAIWDWDLRTDAVWWSEGLETTFGIGPADQPSDTRGWTERIHPDDRSRVLEGLREVIDGTEEVWNDRYRFLRGDGRWAHVVDRSFVLRDDAGGGVRMVGGLSDETERIEAGRKIREQAELLSKARDAIVVRNLDHTVTFWNAGAERLYGWTAYEACGRSVERLLYHDPKSFQEATAQVLVQGDWTGELEQYRKDGTIVAVEGRWTLVRDEHGEPSRILAINTDITERRKLLAQFLRAQRMESLGTLAGGIAHDLNNVLQPILLAIELLKSDLDDPRALEMLDTIGTSARRGADMVTQVLSFARGVKGAQVTVDLEQIIGDLERMVRETFPRSITLRVSVPDDLWRLVGDPTQIHQVLMNLAVNARDAMPDGGTLQIVAENVRVNERRTVLVGRVTPGTYVCVSVIDSGTGMADEITRQIFDPFFTTKETGKGTGLGLSTVASIAHGHGGGVGVDSAPGRGTTFRLFLPASTREAELPDPVSPEAPPRGEGELLLVIEDETSVRRVTRKTLEGFGYRVLTARDGTEAVSVYEERGHEIDLVLTDIMMPVMDGPAVIRTLRSMDPDVRIVAASGMGAEAGTERAADAGVRHFLPKPYSPAMLLEVVHRVLHEADE